MNDQTVQNVVVGAIMLIGIIGSLIKQFGGSRARLRAEAAMAQRPAGPAVRRRLAPPQTAKPIVPPVLRATAPVTTASSARAAAAYAFPTVDLSLPGYDGAPVEAPKRRARALGGGPAIGTPGWAANAVVAAEILGPPVSLRSGATLGAPHAF